MSGILSGDNKTPYRAFKWSTEVSQNEVWQEILEKNKDVYVGGVTPEQFSSDEESAKYYNKLLQPFGYMSPPNYVVPTPYEIAESVIKIDMMLEILNTWDELGLQKRSNSTSQAFMRGLFNGLTFFVFEQPINDDVIGMARLIKSPITREELHWGNAGILVGSLLWWGGIIYWLPKPRRVAHS